MKKLRKLKLIFMDVVSKEILNGEFSFLKSPLLPLTPQNFLKFPKTPLNSSKLPEACQNSLKLLKTP